MQEFKDMQQAVQNKINKIKELCINEENKVVKLIVDKFGFPNNIERQVLCSEKHIRYVNLDDEALLADIRIEFTQGMEVVIYTYVSDVLR